MANDIKGIQKSVNENKVPVITFENNLNTEKIITINDNKQAYTPSNIKKQNTNKDYIVLTPIDGSEPKIIINDKVKTTTNSNTNSDYIIKIEDKIDASLLNLSNISSNNMGQIKGELNYKINGEVVSLLKDGEILGYTSLNELKRAYGSDKIEEIKEIAKQGVLDGTNLDLSKISSTASDANNGNFINENKLNKEFFNKEIQYVIRDDGTVLLSKDGVALGFTTTSALENALGGKVSNTKDTTETNNNQKIENKISTGFTETSTDNIENEQNITNINTNLEAKADAIENNFSNKNVNNFNFRHNESNILAAKAKNMGFTDEQIKIAIGISRWETGNYKHLAGGFNYGGVTGVGDAGHYNQYANYSSSDVGMDAYLSNLKNNYFDKGLNSVETIARKYLGYDDTSSWINGVKGCMS